MNYSEFYEKAAALFLIWYPCHTYEYGESEPGFHIRDLLREMTLACKLVPGFEHIEDNGDRLNPRNFTPEQKEKIYKYFHENPEKWAKHVLGL